MDDEINNIEEWDFEIGDSMDGAGRSPESYEDRPVSVGGILHAIRERHQVRSCAYCGNCIRENEVMYTRDDLVFFCDIGHDKEYMKRHRGQQMHPDERKDRDDRWNESIRERYEEFCPRCGDRRLQRNGQWVCLVCEAREKREAK